MPVQKTRRPAEVKILVVFIVWLALWNTLRLIQAILFWDTLTGYPMRIEPLYLAVSGGAWAMLGFLLGWAAWQRKPWAWGAALGAAAGYGSWVWFDRFVLQGPHGNESFALTVTIAVLVFVLLLLFSRNVRDFYHDR